MRRTSACPRRHGGLRSGPRHSRAIVEDGQEHQCQDRGRDQAANHQDCERTLDLGAGTLGEQEGYQAEGGDCRRNACSVYGRVPAAGVDRAASHDEVVSPGPRLSKYAARPLLRQFASVSSVPILSLTRSLSYRPWPSPTLTQPDTSTARHDLASYLRCLAPPSWAGIRRIRTEFNNRGIGLKEGFPNGKGGSRSRCVSASSVAPPRPVM